MFSRRICMKLLAWIGFAAPLPARADNPVNTFAELKEWIDGLPRRQELGSPTPICAQTGEEYVEVFADYIAPVGDETVAEIIVARTIQSKIIQLLDNADGTIYWRVPLEFETLDRDHWIRVAAYCRLTIAKE